MAKTQALRLQELMQKHGKPPIYTLSLYPVEVKKNRLERLDADDLFLLESERLELCLCKEGIVCAKLSLFKDKAVQKAMIEKVNEKGIEQYNSKKYQKVLFTFSTLQVRKLESTYMIDISDVDISEVKITVNEKEIAKGCLVNVDGKIAVRVTKVIE